ncbi:MAG: NAD+ synthase [Hyphomicrobiaceae bacterium]|nr:NAD+ synthase [Hyphomicrobiaceae bacterium]
MSKKQPENLRLTLAQLNPVVGDISGNSKLAKAAYIEAQQADSDLITFPELFIIGYPPEDLVLKPALQNAAMQAVRELAKLTKDSKTALLIGTPWREHDKLYNAVALLEAGEIAQLIFKHDLPNYSVFDEKRVFAPGPLPEPIKIKGLKLGVPICEDIWSNGDICQHLADRGAQILIVPNGSPFSTHKRQARANIVEQRIKQTGLPLLYVNQIGGQDELVFDGASFVQNTDLSLPLQSPCFEPHISTTSWRKSSTGWACEKAEIASWPDADESVYSALVLGLRDYVQKNGFPGVVLGLSGGVDSAICAALAVDALGPSRVYCVMLPYHYTSKESLTDARECAQALGVPYDSLPIEKPVTGFLEELAPLFKDHKEDVTEENLQSRTRGVMLMAISNKFNLMLVTTGNKSEMSVGYATIYGDMNGGFNPIKDIYKQQVFELCRWRNEHKPAGALGPDGVVIPTNIISKPPSAELREDQRDDDSLPPYDVLDDILESLIEKEMAVADIIKNGHDEETVRRIEHLLYIAEYKRRQAAPGIKITSRNFGRDRRYPITNRFRDPQ